MLAAAVTVTVAAAVIVDGDFLAPPENTYLMQMKSKHIQTNINALQRDSCTTLYFVDGQRRFCSVLVPPPLQMLRLLLLATTTAAVKQVLSWF